jgi:hypothetical protein
MKIEVLGTGCYNCLKLEALLNAILLETGRSDIKLERISDERHIRRLMPLDEIPGLVIDGRLASTRTVPSREELEQWLSAA